MGFCLQTGGEAGARRHTGPAAEREGGTVVRIGSALSDDVDAAGGGEARGSIGGRSRNLKLLDGFLREIECGGADVLVDRVDAIDGDAGLAAGAAGDRNAGVARLSGIEGAALVDFDTGLEAGELEVVAAVPGELRDLRRGDDTADAGFLGFG